MAFIDILLDKAIITGAQGGPDWEPVAVSEQESGDEVREGTKAKALGDWVISYPANDPAHWEWFLDFWYIVNGSIHSWPFYDWLDHDCASGRAYLTALTSTTWQMWKKRTLGSYTYYQKIVLPVAAKTEVSGGGTYSVSRTTGIITKSAGDDPTGFVCREFHKLCRFGTGKLMQTIEVRQNRTRENEIGDEERRILVSYVGIPVKEVPLTSA